jgi:hypothetical protein
MTEAQDKAPFDPEQFLNDMEVAAACISATFCREVCAKAVKVFEDDFRRQVLQWKATDVPGGSLYFRFLSTDSYDPVQRAIHAGIIDTPARHLLDLQPNVLEAISGSVRSGVDFDSQRGFAKVWTYTTPIPVKAALTVKGLPDALQAFAPLYEEFGLEGVGFFATDFIQKSMTIYFGWTKSPVTKPWLDRFYALTSHEPVAESTTEDILASASQLRGVSMTFNWESAHIIRSAIYRFGLSYERSAEREHLPRLPASLQRLVNEAPSLNQESCYHLAWSFGSPCNYMKLEKNYAQSVHAFLAKERGITL